MPKPLAIFDIDGTLFRSSLMWELFRALVKHGIFPPQALYEIDKNYQAWLDRRGDFPTFVMSFVVTYFKYIQGRSETEVCRIARLTVEEQKNRTYVYTRDLINELKDTHTLVAISASPREMVREFQKHWPFEYAFGTISEHRNGRYTGRWIPLQERNKTKIVRELTSNGHSLENSIGIGDTKSDFYFLDMVSHPIAFNPSQELYDYAKTRGWPIVVERKDVIYDI